MCLKLLQMKVKNIQLSAFRNYDSAFVAFNEGVNVISGDNAQGKTNLLEAVYTLTSGKAFRARSDKDAVKNTESSARIKGELYTDGRDQTLEVILNRGRRKELFVNGVKKKTAAEFAGILRGVLFCPDDLNIIKEGAAARRRLMDMCICQLRPRYAEILAKFSKAYEEKTRILRDSEEKPSLLEFLDEYDRLLAVLSAEIIHYRAMFIKALSPAAAEIHREFSGGGENLEIRYKTVSTIDDPERPAAELLPMIEEHQSRHRSAERASRLCLTGAHKDDLEIMIDGMSARDFASQGQTRTASLSIKLAEREIHYRDRGEYPILLLDDVLSELDEKRQSFVLNRIIGGQVFITCCDEAAIREKTGGMIIRVKEGKIF